MPGHQHHRHDGLRPAASFAEFSDARRLTFSTGGAAGSDIQAHFYQMQDLGRVNLTMPPTYDQVVTIQTSGVTTLQGNIGGPVPTYTAGPGDCITLPMGEATAWEWTAAAEIACVFINPAYLAEQHAALVGRSSSLIELTPRANHHDPLLYELGRALRAELAQPGPGGQLYRDSLLQAMLLHIVRTGATSPLRPTAVRGELSQLALRRVLEYIEASLAGEITLAALASVAAMSQYHFTRLFRAATGDPPHRYVTRRRVEKARRLLLTGHSVAGAAHLSGFSDASHLHRAFRHAYGIAPGEMLRSRRLG